MNTASLFSRFPLPLIDTQKLLDIGIIIQSFPVIGHTIVAQFSIDSCREVFSVFILWTFAANKLPFVFKGLQNMTKVAVLFAFIGLTIMRSCKLVTCKRGESLARKKNEKKGYKYRRKMVIVKSSPFVYIELA